MSTTIGNNPKSQDLVNNNQPQNKVFMPDPDLFRQSSEELLKNKEWLDRVVTAGRQFKYSSDE